MYKIDPKTTHNNRPVWENVKLGTFYGLFYSGMWKNNPMIGYSHKMNNSYKSYLTFAAYNCIRPVIKNKFTV